MPSAPRRYRAGELIRAHSPIPLQPVPVCGGWDSRPWHGDNNLVRFGRTPDLFKQHLLDAKRFLDTTEPRPAARWILIEAWNEWGEGSYIEPHKEFGFGYLDAIRDVFTAALQPHLNLTPADVGLGPYDVPPLDLALTRWECDAGDQGWNHLMNLADLRAQNGVLSARATGPDPAFFGPPLQARAGDFTAVCIAFPRDAHNLHWQCRDPSEARGNTSERMEAYRAARDELRSMIGQWLEEIRRATS